MRESLSFTSPQCVLTGLTAPGKKVKHYLIDQTKSLKSTTPTSIKAGRVHNVCSREGRVGYGDVSIFPYIDVEVRPIPTLPPPTM